MTSDLSLTLANARTPDMDPDLAQRLLAIQTAQKKGDFSQSTALIRKFIGVSESFLTDGALRAGHLPTDVQITKVEFNDKPLGLQVDFDEVMLHLGLCLPILNDGTALTGTFGYFAYPGKYMPLFGEDASRAFRQLADTPTQIDNIITAPMKDVYYHMLMDTLPHLAGTALNARAPDTSVLYPDWAFTRPWEKQVLAHFLHVFQLTDLQFVGVKVDALKAGRARLLAPANLAARLMILEQLIVPAHDLPDAPYIYLQRSPDHSRRLQNEEALLERLGPRFTVIRPDELDFMNQIKLAAQATCIVGVHGSNLANIAFCKPGTALVELSAGIPQDFYERIAREKFMPYRRVQGMFDRSGETPTADFHLDFIIDVERVVQAVDEVLSTD